MLSFGDILRDYKIKSIKLCEETLKKFLRLKTFLKMFIGFKCRDPEVELRFCSFLELVHFSTASMDKEK